MRQTDRQTSDVRQHHRLMCLLGAGHNRQETVHEKRKITNKHGQIAPPRHTHSENFTLSCGHENGSSLSTPQSRHTATLSGYKLGASDSALMLTLCALQMLVLLLLLLLLSKRRRSYDR